MFLNVAANKNPIACAARNRAEFSDEQGHWQALDRTLTQEVHHKNLIAGLVKLDNPGTPGQLQKG